MGFCRLSDKSSGQKCLVFNDIAAAVRLSGLAAASSLQGWPLAGSPASTVRVSESLCWLFSPWPASRHGVEPRNVQKLKPATSPGSRTLPPDQISFWRNGSSQRSTTIE